MNLDTRMSPAYVAWAKEAYALTALISTWTSWNAGVAYAEDKATKDMVTKDLELVRLKKANAELTEDFNTLKEQNAALIKELAFTITANENLIKEISGPGGWVEMCEVRQKDICRLCIERDSLRSSQSLSRFFKFWRKA